MQNYLMYILIFICLSNGHNTLLGCDNNNNNNNNHTTNPKAKRKALNISISPKSSDSDDEYMPTSDFESDLDDSEDPIYILESDDESSNHKSHGSFSKSFNDQLSPVKGKKAKSKKNNSNPPRQRKTPGEYYVCILCAKQENFMNAKDNGRINAMYTSYNSYSNNSRVMHRSIYNECEKNGKGEGAKWLKANCCILKCNPNTPPLQVAFQFKNQLKSQDFDAVIKDLEQKEQERLKKKGNNQFFAEE